MARRRISMSGRRIAAWTVVILGLATLGMMALCAGAGWWLWIREREPDLVPRVLFCETANCSAQERQLVAGVMRNRIREPAFGNGADLEAVVRQPGAFSCIDDPDNTLWSRSAHPARLTAAERVIWRECAQLAHGPIPAAVGPSGRPLVYYHDKSIGKPRSWDNAAWRAIPERTTTHFVFYSVVPAGH